MFNVQKTATFLNWLRTLRDIRAVARIQIRIDRLALGNMGDAKSVGQGVTELRVDYGPGYRDYFTKRGQKIIVLLCGGDKRSQESDIDLAQRMTKDL
jgi:putative addiction module killer protein